MVVVCAAAVARIVRVSHDQRTHWGGGVAETVLRAVAGAKQSQIIDGRIPHSLLGELFTHRGVGTMITRGPIDRPNHN